MITAFHSTVVDVPDFEVAVRDYTRLMGMEPLRIESNLARETRSAFFKLANMMLELRAGIGTSTADANTAAAGGKFGQAGIRLVSAEDASVTELTARGVVVASSADEEARFEAAPGIRRWRAQRIDPNSSRGLSVELISHETIEGAEYGVEAVSSVDPAARILALDHVVVMSPDPEGSRAFYGEGLGIRLALDKTFEKRGVRLIFFRVGGTTIEIGARVGVDPQPDRPDAFGGLAWQVVDVEAIQARLTGEGFDVSGIRAGNKSGTRVCTVRDPVHSVPTLLIEPAA
jgi:catechol 2,3-dioxygenase-like lactoylglutathione lyase family enzyme